MSDRPLTRWPARRRARQPAPPATDSPRLSRSRWSALATTALLSAVVITWAALPAKQGPGARIALIAAIAAAAGGAAQLAIAGIPARPPGIMSPLERTVDQLAAGIRALPWAELLVVAVIILEALHPSRPWHTGLLAVALLGYLLAVHLAETRASAGVLRPQLALLAAGIGLVALSVGAAALPALPAGSASSVLRVIAVAAAVIAAGLAVPAWLRRS